MTKGGKSEIELEKTQRPGRNEGPGDDEEGALT